MIIFKLWSTMVPITPIAHKQPSQVTLEMADGPWMTREKGKNVIVTVQKEALPDQPNGLGLSTSKSDNVSLVPLLFKGESSNIPLEESETATTNPGIESDLELACDDPKANGEHFVQSINPQRVQMSHIIRNPQIGIPEANAFAVLVDDADEACGSNMGTLMKGNEIEASYMEEVEEGEIAEASLEGNHCGKDSGKATVNSEQQQVSLPSPKDMHPSPKATHVQNKKNNKGSSSGKKTHSRKRF